MHCCLSERIFVADKLFCNSSPVYTLHGAIAAENCANLERRKLLILYGAQILGELGVLTPWKYVRGIRVCFDPLKCHILSSKFHIIKDERLVSKMEGKTGHCKPLQNVQGQKGQQGHTRPTTAIGRDANRGRVSVIVAVLTNASHCTGIWRLLTS